MHLGGSGTSDVHELASACHGYFQFQIAIKKVMDAMNDVDAKADPVNPPNDGPAKSRTSARRIEGKRGTPVTFTFDGQLIEAFEGETIATALLVSGVRMLRETDRRGEPRGLFCNMGICFDCLVEIDGATNQRACQFLVIDGLEIKSQPSDPMEHCE